MIFIFIRKKIVRITVFPCAFMTSCDCSKTELVKKKNSNNKRTRVMKVTVRYEI